MRFHIGLSINAKKLLKFLMPLLVGLLAYFGIANITALASTISLSPNSVELCNNATNTCSTNWLERYQGSSSVRYTTMSGYGAISTFKAYYNSSEFSYYCYEPQYDFHATYKLTYRLLYRGGQSDQTGYFSSIRVYANNSAIPTRVSQDSSGYYTVSFDYPGYDKNIRIDFLQSDSNIGTYPMAFYSQISGDITCLDQTTLASVNQSINNGVASINENTNNNANNIMNNNNQNTQEITNTLTDETAPNISINSFNDLIYVPTGLSELLLFPITLLNTIVNNSDTCTPISFDLSSITTRWGGEPYVLTLPCIRAKMQELLGSWYNIFDLIIAGILFYYFSMNLILKVNDILSGADLMPSFYHSSSRNRTTSLADISRERGHY